MNTDNILGNRMNAIDHQEFLSQAQRERQQLEDETRLRLGECRSSEWLLAQALLIMELKQDQAKQEQNEAVYSQP